MKRRSVQPKKLRDRRTGKSPYQRHKKREYQYKMKAEFTPRAGILVQ